MIKYIVIALCLIATKNSFANDTLTVDQQILVDNIVINEKPTAFTTTVNDSFVVLTMIFPKSLMTYYIMNLDIVNLVEFYKGSTVAIVYGSEYD
jgi:hypothetical protein